jgi:acetoin utilization deacetylase AcuC-like enzyme
MPAELTVTVNQPPPQPDVSAAPSYRLITGFIRFVGTSFVIRRNNVGSFGLSLGARHQPSDRSASAEELQDVFQPQSHPQYHPQYQTSVMKVNRGGGAELAGIEMETAPAPIEPAAFAGLGPPSASAVADAGARGPVVLQVNGADVAGVSMSSIADMFKASTETVHVTLSDLAGPRSLTRARSGEGALRPLLQTCADAAAVAAKGGPFEEPDQRQLVQIEFPRPSAVVEGPKGKKGKNKKTDPKVKAEKKQPPSPPKEKLDKKAQKAQKAAQKRIPPHGVSWGPGVDRVAVNIAIEECVKEMSNTTAIFSHTGMLSHKVPADMPEVPCRLRRCLQRMRLLMHAQQRMWETVGEEAEEERERRLHSSSADSDFGHESSANPSLRVDTALEKAKGKGRSKGVKGKTSRPLMLDGSIETPGLPLPRKLELCVFSNTVNNPAPSPTPAPAPAPAPAPPPSSSLPAIGPIVGDAAIAAAMGPPAASRASDGVGAAAAVGSAPIGTKPEIKIVPAHIVQTAAHMQGLPARSVWAPPLPRPDPACLLSVHDPEYMQAIKEGCYLLAEYQQLAAAQEKQALTKGSKSKNQDKSGASAMGKFPGGFLKGQRVFKPEFVSISALLEGNWWESKEEDEQKEGADGQPAAPKKCIGSPHAKRKSRKCSWVQCEKCDKWRKLDQGVEAWEGHFVCEMNGWDMERASCEQGEEVETEDEGHAHAEEEDEDDGEEEDLAEDAQDGQKPKRKRKRRSRSAGASPSLKSPSMHTLRAQIRVVMKKRSLSQIDLARELGQSPHLVSSFLRKPKPGGGGGGGAQLALASPSSINASPRAQRETANRLRGWLREQTEAEIGDVAPVKSGGKSSKTSAQQLKGMALGMFKNLALMLGRRNIHGLQQTISDFLQTAEPSKEFNKFMAQARQLRQLLYQTDPHLDISCWEQCEHQINLVRKEAVKKWSSSEFPKPRIKRVEQSSPKKESVCATEATATVAGTDASSSDQGTPSGGCASSMNGSTENSKTRRPDTAYVRFCRVKRAEVAGKIYGEEMGRMWREASPEAKKPYIDAYEQETSEWKAKRATEGGGDDDEEEEEEDEMMIDEGVATAESEKGSEDGDGKERRRKRGRPELESGGVAEGVPEVQQSIAGTAETTPPEQAMTDVTEQQAVDEPKKVEDVLQLEAQANGVEGSSTADTQMRKTEASEQTQEPQKGQDEVMGEAQGEAQQAKEQEGVTEIEQADAAKEEEINEEKTSAEVAQVGGTFEPERRGEDAEGGSGNEKSGDSKEGAAEAMVVGAVSQVPKEEVKAEKNRQEEAKEGEAKEGGIRQEEAKKEEIRQEEAKKREIRQEEVKKEEFKKEEVPLGWEKVPAAPTSSVNAARADSPGAVQEPRSIFTSTAEQAVVVSVEQPTEVKVEQRITSTDETPSIFTPLADPAASLADIQASQPGFASPEAVVPLPRSTGSPDLSSSYPPSLALALATASGMQLVEDLTKPKKLKKPKPKKPKEDGMDPMTNAPDGDPGPKRPLTAYIRFCQVMRTKRSDKITGEEMGTLWRETAAEEKKPFEEAYEKDMVEYNKIIATRPKPDKKRKRDDEPGKMGKKKNKKDKKKKKRGENDAGIVDDWICCAYLPANDVRPTKGNTISPSFVEDESEKEDDEDDFLEQNDDDVEDTYVSAGSWNAAMLGTSVVCKGVDRVMIGNLLRGNKGATETEKHIAAVTNPSEPEPGSQPPLPGSTNAFCLLRPPGHHAGYSGTTENCTTNGFCLLNHAVIGVQHSRLRWGLKRVAVVDIDVHYGNGTAELLEHDEDAFFASVHLRDSTGEFYPGELCVGPDVVSDKLVSVAVGPAGGGLSPRHNSDADADGEDASKDDAATAGSSGNGSIRGSSSRGSSIRGNSSSSAAAVEDSKLDAMEESTEEGGDFAAAVAAVLPEQDLSNSTAKQPSKLDAATQAKLAQLKGAAGFRAALIEFILPKLMKFKPELLFVSSGFDGLASDPLGGDMGLRPADYHFAVSELVKVANSLPECNGRIVCVMEGGYDVDETTDGLALAAEAVAKALLYTR